jgi:chromosomal replication initiation ATPase DnaA
MDIRSNPSSYKMTSDEICAMSKGPNSANTPRKIAMYLCQELSGTTLKRIADHSNLNHAGSVSYITHKIRQKMLVDSIFKREIEKMIGYIAITAT